MKQILTSAIILLFTASNTWAQKYPEGFLTDKTGPSDYDFVQAPPTMTSGAFAEDFYYYQWGIQQREIEGKSEKALSDEMTTLYEAFSSCAGINLTPEETPEITLLCLRTVADISKANTAVKNKYQRKRPFATFNAPSLKPETDDYVAKTFSYPSGHSSRGYAFAMALCTVIPSQTTAIMLRAQEYALNRVVCGHHWKSDTEASLLLAATMFTNVVCTDEYQAQLQKARAEYQRLSNR